MCECQCLHHEKTSHQGWRGSAGHWLAIHYMWRWRLGYWEAYPWQHSQAKHQRWYRCGNTIRLFRQGQPMIRSASTKLFWMWNSMGLNLIPKTLITLIAMILEILLSLSSRTIFQALLPQGPILLVSSSSIPMVQIMDASSSPLSFDSNPSHIPISTLYYSSFFGYHLLFAFSLGVKLVYWEWKHKKVKF